MIKKNKALTWMLLLVVVGIYATIAYKSYANKKLTEEHIQEYAPDLSFSPANYKKEDFKIDFQLNDPFRSSARIRKRNPAPETQNNYSPQISQRVRPQQPVTPPIAVKWPEIKYFGFVRNTEKPNSLCLLSINGELIKKEKSQSHKGIEILNVFKDSVVVSFQGKLKTVAKQ